MKTRPIQYAIYKGVKGKWGAVQFDFRPAILAENPRENKEGVIFMSITSTKAPDVYDWENKIVFALSLNDVSTLLLALRTDGKASIMHDPHANSDKAREVSKTLNLSSPKGLEAGCFLNMTEKRGSEEVAKHSVPLSPTECMALGTLFQAALPRMLGWT